MRASNDAPLLWSFKNRSCAEAAFVVAADETSMASLYIVEMKSKLNLSRFCKVIAQWRGMYLSSLAVLGAMRTSEPEIS